MQRSPIALAAVAIAAVLVLTALAWALVLVFGSGPMAESAATLLAVDQLILGTVIGVGMVLARGRWTRRAGFVLLGGQAVLGVFFEADGWWIAAVVMTAMGIAALAGPWLNGWLRKLPRADGPPPQAVVLSLGMAGLPTLVAVTAPGGVPTGGWLLSAFALGAAWAYTQAWLPALWSARVALPVLGIGAAAALTWLGGLLLGCGVTVLTLLAWTPAVRQATRTPAAVPTSLIPIPPELAPHDVLEAAGLDDRGRPKPRSNP